MLLRLRRACLAHSLSMLAQLLSESLRPVAIFDSTILALPEEPIDMLCRQYGITLGDHKYIPEERLMLTQETKRYILAMHHKLSYKGQTPSERHMFAIDSGMSHPSGDFREEHIEADYHRL